MASRKRGLLEPTDDWQQLQFQLDWTEQARYELIRPVVVFGSPPVERSKQTGVSARTIYRRVSRFDKLGMQSLFEADPADDKRQLPQAIHQAIIQTRPSARTNSRPFAMSASGGGPARTRSRRSWPPSRPRLNSDVGSPATPR